VSDQEGEGEGVSTGVVSIPAGVASVPAGVIVSAGVSAGDTVSAGVVVSIGAVSSSGWQAANVVIKPNRTRTKTFVFTVNILTFNLKVSAVFLSLQKCCTHLQKKGKDFLAYFLLLKLNIAIPWTEILSNSTQTKMRR
jgi:hypothetical protein